MFIENRDILVKEIVRTICHDENEIESPSWHNVILTNRLKRITNNKAKLISIDTLKIGVKYDCNL